VGEDPCIPANPDNKPLFRDPEAEVTHVNELIDDEVMTWDKGKHRVLSVLFEESKWPYFRRVLISRQRSRP
jgi:hypothetical protein